MSSEADMYFKLKRVFSCWKSDTGYGQIEILSGSIIGQEMWENRSDNTVTIDVKLSRTRIFLSAQKARAIARALLAAADEIDGAVDAADRFNRLKP